MNARPRMKRFPHHTPPFALPFLLLCTILVLFMCALPATADVPAVLLACSHATSPSANFTCSFPEAPSATVPDGPPYTIKCIDNSSVEPNQSIASWKWDFGDGGTSTDQNPRHTYSEASSYDIRLKVTTFCGEQYTNTTVRFISIYCSVPEPGFTTNVTEGYAPLAVGVTDSSKNTRQDISRWIYWFDNADSSSERNPVFVYTAPGTYTINQTVWKDCIQLGSSFYSPATRQIKVNPPLTVLPANETNMTPASPVTAAVPVAPAPVVTSVVPGPGTATEPAPDSAVVPGTGTLSVNTEPAGAQVFIDDVLRGTTPATVPDLSPGSHTLRLEEEGYTSMTIPIQITGGQTNTLSTSLLPVSGGIAILPVIALGLIILGVIGMGIFLVKRQRQQQ